MAGRFKSNDPFRTSLRVRPKPVVQTSKLASSQEFIGLSNKIGEMNCFLNSAIQALWQIEGFRKSLFSFECPIPSLGCCLPCTLKKIFQEMSQSRSKPVDITRLRNHLAEVYEFMGEFHLGNTADSMEVLVQLLTSIHCVSLGDLTQGTNSVMSSHACDSCPAHLAVDLVIKECIVCKCGASEEFQWDRCTFVHPFYVADICEKVRDMDSSCLLGKDANELLENIENSTVLKHEGKLPQLIRGQWELLELNLCPDDSCEIKSSRKLLKLESRPNNFMVNCVWNHRNPSQLEILQMAASIPCFLRMDQIYLEASEDKYSLKGIILYGHGHYVYFTRQEKGKWGVLDDEVYSILGKGRWFDAVFEMINKRYNPTGLIYQAVPSPEFSVSLIDWLRLEQWVLKVEQERIQYLKKAQRRNLPLLRPNTGLLVSAKGKREAPAPEEEPTWDCDCGTTNKKTDNFCGKCGTLQPDIPGWTCKYCTFANIESATSCKICKQPKLTLLRAWRCSFCKHPNRGSSRCLNCKSDKDAEPGEKCPRCNSTNAKLRNTCWKCTSSLKCANCQSRTAIEDGVCNNCKLKQCQHCEREFRGDLCDKCFHQCKSCDKKFQHCFCPVCKNETEQWMCSNCSSEVPARLRTCQECVQKIWKCANCEDLQLPKHERCVKCTKNISSRNETRIKKTKSFKFGFKCKVCNKLVNVADRNMCSTCGRRAAGENCRRCVPGVKYYLCQDCAKVHWVCKCGNSQFKSRKTCSSCGFKRPT